MDTVIAVTDIIACNDVAAGVGERDTESAVGDSVICNVVVA